jgi:hypothetical protein
MAKSKFSVNEQAQIKRIMNEEGVIRKTAIRHLFGGKGAGAISKSKLRSKRRPKTPLPAAVQVSKNRAEGLRLFALAGRPTKAQFVMVYGKRGHLMTWSERAEAGVPAKKFQAALAEKGGSRPSKPARRKKQSGPARTTKKSVRTPAAKANVPDQVPATLNAGN